MLDRHGRKVVEFMGKVKNLTRLAELTDSIADIATSGDWRRYTTAIGTEMWREAEFDYFLIACDLPYADVAKVLAYNRRGVELAPLMDRNAPATKRRTLDKASAAWSGPSPESLVERAERLGWINSPRAVGRNPNYALRTPVSSQALLRAATGLSQVEQARQNRADQIPAKRRRELDRLVRSVIDQTDDATEARYLIDRIKSSLDSIRRAASS